MDVAGLGQFARACQTRTYLEADNPGSILHFGTPCSHEIVSPPITITFNDHTCKHRTYMQRILNPDPKSFSHHQDSRFKTSFFQYSVCFKTCPANGNDVKLSKGAMTQIRHTRPRGCPFLPSFQGTHGSQLGKQPFGNGERLLDVVLQYLHVFTLTMEPGASDPATDEGGIEGTEELAYKPPESQMISNLPEPNDYTCQFVRTLNHCITA